MTVCFCPRCCDDPLPTYTERFRAECETRYVKAMSGDHRTAYLAGVKKFRGEKAATELLTMVLAK